MHCTALARLAIKIAIAMLIDRLDLSTKYANNLPTLSFTRRRTGLEMLVNLRCWRQRPLAG